jgi:DNA-binding transcriptional LysR family regulator
MTEITLRQLRYFDALASHGRFGRAATACGISQPALSMQIKELEEVLGAALVERGARQVRLTSFGEEAVLRAREILRSVDEMGDLARASRDRLAGRLRIGMIPTIAPYFLPTAIANIGRKHPELDIHVREALTSTLIQELVEGRLDAAVVALPVSEPSLAEVALFKEQFLLVRPSEEDGTPVPHGQKAALDEIAVAGGRALFSRSGLVVLQDAILAAPGRAGRELSIDACANGQRRDGRDLDSGDGGSGGDAFGIGFRRSLQQSTTLADHRHDLAQEKSSGRTASAAV